MTVGQAPEGLSLPAAMREAAIRLTRWSCGALLVIAVCVTGCGTGISLDPMSFDQPDTGDSGGDGGQTPVTDTSPLDDVADGGGDTSIDEDSAIFDGRSDLSELPDRRGDEGASDGGVEDRSADVEIDRDVSNDVGIDVGIDRSTEAGVDGDAGGVDRDGAGANPDAGDVSSETSDAPKDSAFEVVTADTVDGCHVGCVPAFDYYVDASAPPGGNGSEEAPFRTISAAIEAHVRAPSQARTAYVAAGTYDEALGETFPLLLRGLSLQGAGADQTFILGSGMFDHAGQGGPKNLQYMVTMVAGDRTLQTKVSRVSLRPVGPVPTVGTYGLFCDRGNATGEVASPAGQTHLDEISVGPGYDRSVLAVASTIPSVTGCNMLITRSTVTGGWGGIEAIGCIGSTTAGPVMLQMGTDDPTSGNNVSWMQSASMGTGVYAGSCVVRASFQYNSISDCNIALNVDESFGGSTPWSLRRFSIKHNTFARMSSQGLIAGGISLFIEEVSDNRFFDTTRSPNSTELAIAMHIFLPIVGKLRRNVFIGNDFGLVLDQGTEHTDLGRPGDPGGNVFSCNSALDSWAGADVMVLYPMSPGTGAGPNMRGSKSVGAADGGVDDGGPDAGEDTLDVGDADGPALLPFAGNSWDHDPPRVSEFGENGTEIRLDFAPPLPFDLSGSSLVTGPCPAGRVP